MSVMQHCVSVPRTPRQRTGEVWLHLGFPMPGDRHCSFLCVSRPGVSVPRLRVCLPDAICFDLALHAKGVTAPLFGASMSDVDVPRPRAGPPGATVSRLWVCMPGVTVPRLGASMPCETVPWLCASRPGVTVPRICTVMPGVDATRPWGASTPCLHVARLVPECQVCPCLGFASRPGAGVSVLCLHQ